MSKKIVVLCVCAIAAVIVGAGVMLTSKSSATDAGVREQPQSNVLTPDVPSTNNTKPPVSDARLISVSPKSLVVKAEDLSSTFTINSGESPAKNEYSHVYFNPYALLDGEQRDHGLLGIIVHIKVLDSFVSARREFVGQGGFDLEAVKADIRKVTPGAKPISIEPYSLTLDKADKVVAYRVHYLLQGVYVYDYRCRMRVSNVVTNMVVSARGTVDIEPADLQKQAVEIFQKQRNCLLQAVD